MAFASVDSSWQGLLKPEWLRAIHGTSFLSRCREGKASAGELRLFVQQHHQYSRHFTRYLCALIASIADERGRAALMQNLVDEMGIASGGGVSHAEIYRRMMAAMLLPIDDGAVLPETQQLTETMFECCGSRRPMMGLGALCLGAEAIVPEMYTAILRGFEALREPAENLEFFRIHVAADDEHAVTMRGIVLAQLEREPGSRLDLEYGAARAISARVAFFEGISRHARCEATAR
jgi:pyrroloquinoline quinone (PQQ) biosynthesis protein C